MRLIKKDWMYDANITVVSIMSGAIGLGVAFMLFLNSGDEIRETLYYIYELPYKVGAMIVLIYPFFAFKAICPQLGSDKLYLSTANLPYSRKEIFYKSLKKWALIYPIFLILITTIIVIINPAQGNFMDLFIKELSKPLTVGVFGLIIQCQMFSGTIFTLAKGYKWYKVLVTYLFTNTLLFTIFGLCMYGANGNIEVEWAILPIAGIIYLLISIITFLISWRDVERIWQ